MSILPEILRIDSISGDYIKFVDWKKKLADRIDTSKIQMGQYLFQWAAKDTTVIVIIYSIENSNDPMGYMYLNKIKDGYMVISLGVKKEHRGKNISMLLYDYVISKTTLYSDYQQSPAARKLWVKLFYKYTVVGYDIPSGNYFEVAPNSTGTELESLDPKYELYVSNTPVAEDTILAVL